MMKSSKRLSIVVLAMSVCFLTENAGAWELITSGEFIYNYQYFCQTGTNGFFGKYDSATAAGPPANPFSPPAPPPPAGAGDFAPYNFWAGWHRRAGIVSGSDAAWQTYWMDTNIELRINPALRIRGLYRIGEWATSSIPAANNPTAPADLGIGDLVASEYLEYRHSGVQRSMSPGYWNYLFMTAQLPWGIVNFGKRPSGFGTGLGWAADNRSSETFSVSALYGPWDFTLGVYPGRRGGGSYYNRDRDKNNTRAYDFGPVIAYRSGAVDMGLTVQWGPNWHFGGEGVVGSVQRNSSTYTYVNNHAETYGGAYLKYDNGRFFINTELDWNQTTRKTQGALPTNIIGRGGIAAPGYQIRDTSIDHWRYAVEVGTYSGPAKLSGLFAWLSGGDRRGIIYPYALLFDPVPSYLIGQIDNTGILRSNLFANTSFFRPYSYLINEVYGTGVFQNTDTTNGYIEDAVIWAARLDYALAANLNIALSFMWADRASKSGFGWGCIKPWMDSVNVADYMGQMDSDRIFNQSNNLNTPNIPDTNLGYEIDAAIDWKLIEGLVLKTTLAYWQPGKWFNWACTDKNISVQYDWTRYAPWLQSEGIGWASNSIGAPAWGSSIFSVASAHDVYVNPNRTIDPVLALELKVVGEF